MKIFLPSKIEAAHSVRVKYAICVFSGTADLSLDLVLQLRGFGKDTGRATGFEHGTRSAVDDVLLVLVDDVKGSQWAGSFELAF